LEFVENEQIVRTVIPHADYGDPDCWGCLNAVLNGDTAKVFCNLCDATVRIVAAADLQRTLDEMQLALDVATAKCPSCEAVHVASGFSELIAFKCDNCGRTVKLKNDPNVEKLFGC
jgi:Zn finger protein HypA/HybF involved in hydrogenase expression